MKHNRPSRGVTRCSCYEAHVERTSHAAHLRGHLLVAEPMAEKGAQEPVLLSSNR